jgi:predicted Rossmann fold flavoprotein
MNIIVVGGGAAGFFSAIHHKISHPNDEVVILEQSREVLAKVKISGGGRCNVTHACFEPKQLIEHYPRGGKELLGPFHHFSPKDTMDWFTGHGVPLKIEADNRVFPVSNSSQDIIDCLVNTSNRLGVKILTEVQVKHISKTDSKFCLSLADGTVMYGEKVILATGSSRKGYEFAQQLGHTIKPPIPSLFTLKINDKALWELSGLSVKHVEAALAGEKKSIQKGPLLLTHWGMSGPAIIKLSAWSAQYLYDNGYKAQLMVNWLPHITPQKLLNLLFTIQTQHPKKIAAKHSLFTEIPGRLWEYLIKKSGILENQTWNQLNAKQIDVLALALQKSTFEVTGKGTFKDEFVTCGGVSLKEVNFKTMESKCCEGLYIVGELLDIDGVTGGFNFQNAWTTGYLAGG